MLRSVLATLTALSVSSLLSCSSPSQTPQESRQVNSPNAARADINLTASEKSPLAPSPSDEFSRSADVANLIGALEEGGKIIYLRHSSTDGKTYKDQAQAKMGDCETQRSLGEKGWKESFVIQQGLANVPVGAVYSSEYCRAWQTAQLTFGFYELDSRLTAMSEAPSEDEKNQRKAEATPLFSTQPTDGSNTVLVGHSDVIQLMTGEKPPQGGAVVIEPTGDSYTVLGTITVEDY